MKQPSEKALRLAEEIFDHVAYGLTRSDVLQELAEMVDESNGNLLESVSRGMVESPAPITTRMAEPALNRVPILSY